MPSFRVSPNARQPAADGCTISMFGNNRTIVPNTDKQVPYDVERDFAPIGVVATLNNVLVVYPSVPVRNAGEFLGLARVKSGQVQFASDDTGAITHVAGGQVHSLLLNMVNATPHMTSGRLRGLAATSAKRSRFLPELPPLEEAGMKGYELTEWYGIVAPARAPVAVLDRRQQPRPQIVGSEAMRERWRGTPLSCATPASSRNDRLSAFAGRSLQGRPGASGTVTPRALPRPGRPWTTW
jgi:tripartite-type tricarboxylate transporter receptor subunit TctC